MPDTCERCGAFIVVAERSTDRLMAEVERMLFGSGPIVTVESPRGVGCEVRGVTEQEVGLFARPLLPPVRYPADTCSSFGTTPKKTKTP